MTEEQSGATQKRPRSLCEENIRDTQLGDVLVDAKIKGLQLRHKATKKVFCFYYRTKSGVERRPTLGAYGMITLSQARRMAQALAEQVGMGKDPSKLSQDARDEKTVEDLWVEWRKRWGAGKKSEKEDKRLWVKKCQGIARKRLSDITFEVAADLHKAITKSAPISANRTVALLRAMFRKAMAPLEWTAKNPFEALELNKEVKRKRYVTDDEAPRIEAELQAEAKDNPASVAFIYLLVYTGARRGEIAKARWSDLTTHTVSVDGQEVKVGALALADHKTDQSGEARVIYLGPAAMAVIERLPKTSGTITGVLSPTKLWQKIRKNAQCEGLRLHDLRHSFASAAIGGGFTLAQTGELLGHGTAQTTKRYAHLMTKSASLAAISITKTISARLTPAADPARSPAERSDPGCSPAPASQSLQAEPDSHPPSA